MSDAKGVAAMATLLKREIQARLTKQGNSTSLNLPHEVLQAACLARGDTVTITTDLTTLMSLFQSVRHERSSPDRLGSKCLAEDRAWQGAALKTTVEQTLMRGLATAGPVPSRGCLGLGAGRR
jgi:antitoxin component of MazEF toxin-antitoxin module